MEEFKVIITQEEINELPLGVFEGKIHLITNREKAEEIGRSLLAESFLGFDTESRPSFKKGQHYPIALMQFSTESDAYLFKVSKTGVPQSLKDLFANPQVAKIGLGLQQDLSEMNAKGMQCTNFIDLEKIAATHKFKQRGIRALAAYFLKLRISKSAQKSNWARDDLSPAQLKYAATDAWTCLKIYQVMIEQGFWKQG